MYFRMNSPAELVPVARRPSNITCEQGRSDCKIENISLVSKSLVLAEQSATGLTNRQDPSDDQEEYLELYACRRSPLIVHGKGIRDQAVNVSSCEQRNV